MYIARRWSTDLWQLVDNVIVFQVGDSVTVRLGALVSLDHQL